MTAHHQNDFIPDSRYIRKLLDKIPIFHDKGINAIEEIIGGWTNSNYRIDTNEGSYFLRLHGENSEILGFDRSREYWILKSASEAGIAPKVTYFNNDERVLITEFIQCQPLSPDELMEADTIKRVAEILRRIHSLPKSSAKFCPFEQAIHWIRLAESYNNSLRGENEALIERMNTVKQAIAENHSTRLCHNDFVCSNILNCRDLMVVDWECAANGNPLFDIASIVMNGQLSTIHEQMLIEYYRKDELLIQKNLLEPWKLAFDYLNGAFYLLNSTIQNDNKRNYRRGASHHFTRLKQSLEKA